LWDLRSSVLEDGDLDTVLRDAGTRLTAGQPVQFDFVMHGTPRPFTSKRKQEHLLRLAQEAVTNAVRHARASRIRMELEYRKDALALLVVDDGVGFDVSAVESAPATHWGLSSMRERAAQIGAQCRIESRPGGGTSVHIFTPFEWTVDLGETA
jgi:signal transduction histidine kinase